MLTEKDLNKQDFSTLCSLANIPVQVAKKLKYDKLVLITIILECHEWI